MTSSGFSMDYHAGFPDAARHRSLAFGESMSAVTENESWVVDRGALLIEKKAQSGADSLNEWERLVYCLWLADYMMRNAGDFANAVDMYPDFQRDAKRLAEQLSLPLTCEAFGLSRRKLQREYFERFETICDEIRSAEPSAAPNHGPATQLGNSNVAEEPPSVS